MGAGLSGARLSIFNGILFSVVALSGCSDNANEQKIEFARNAVSVSLESWKQDLSTDTLRTAEDSIDFHDDDRDAGRQLFDFEIRQSWMEVDGTARVAVTLKVQQGTETPVEVRCTYQIVTEPKVIIARDPMS